MTTVPSLSSRPMTVAEFLAWSEDLRDHARYELVDGVPVRLMAPTNIRHAQIRWNVGAGLRQALASVGTACEVFDAGPGVAMSVQGSECRIPDVVVTCAVEIDETARLVPEPLILVEVASPSPRLADVSDKAEFYGEILSVRHYLVIEQDQRRVVHFGRGAGGRLEPRLLREGNVVLDPPGIELALDALYLDTELARPGTGEEA